MNKVKNYLIGYIQAQLVVTLISMPILISWGIPLSLMAFLGNLIFLPIITTFLIISSILFFTELFGIPNSLFAYFLDKNTDLFEYLLGFGKSKWLIGFAKPHIIVLILITILTILIIRSFNKPLIRIALLSALLTITTTYLHFTKPKAVQKHSVPLTKEKLTIKPAKDGLSITDDGQFNTKGNPENFVNFELKPYLFKNYGNTTIHSLTLLRPGVRSFKGAIALVKAFNIKKVKIKFKKKISKYAWKCYFDLKHEVEQQQGKIIKLKTHNSFKKK